MRCLLLAAGAAAALAWDVARTPPMGWNSWNYWHCDVNATVLMDTAKAMVDTGLAKAGYEYVNSDDCWMLLQRDSQGRQVPNPSKFPQGWPPVVAYINSLGLKAGLYTAKGPTTCAGFAASCDHEALDAATWASWGIEYVKDDSCSTCPNRTDNDDYAAMWQGIQASGKPMVLTVEGDPVDSTITNGGYGNAKRVGHDISPDWGSMLSLVDIGSGLWPYAHNSTNATYGGWWNDLDMIEVGNAPDFACGADADALVRCQAHFTMWTIMKAVLLLGNNVPAIDGPTLAVLTNAEAIAVNQDPWGIQARRVAVYPPANTTLGGPWDNMAVVAPCTPSKSTQAWRWTNTTSPVRNELWTAPCNGQDPYQQWSFAGGLLKNVGSGLCVDAAGPFDPGQVAPCNNASSTQAWALNMSSGHVGTPAGRCLDVYDFSGPDVEIGSCKTPGDQDSNQVWNYRGGNLVSASTGLPANSCLVVSGGQGGGVLSTVDGAGNKWCLNNRFGAEGGWGGDPCTDATCSNCPAFVPTGRSPAAPGPANYSLTNARGSPQWNNQQGASGPWPHTRYINGWSWGGSGGTWTIDLTAAQTPAGTSVMASDHVGILDDDLVGHVGQGGDFCLDLTTGGMLEVWAGALSGNRIAVALFNRSPAPDTITAQWADIGAGSGTYAVRDIWAAADKGSYTGSYTATVPAHGTVYLVLTPA